MKPKKIVSIILIIALAIGLVAGVASYTANMEAKASEPGIISENALVTDPGTIMTVGDYEISFADYRHFYLTNKQYIESIFGDTYYDDDVDYAKEYELKYATDNTLIDECVWLQYAAENNITLSDEEQAEIDSGLAQKKEEMGDSFSSYLKEQFYENEDQYIRMEQNRILSQKAKQEYTDEITEENEDEILNESVVSAKHILLTPPEDGQSLPEFNPDDLQAIIAGSGNDTDASETEPDTAPEDSETENSEAEVQSEEENTEETKDTEAETEDTEEEKAEEGTVDEEESNSETETNDDPTYGVALDMAQFLQEASEEDREALFDAMIQMYSSDSGQPEEGYTFGAGRMVEEFYQGALALEVGQVSDPVQTDYGYHIILRLPLDQTYVDENYDELVSTAINQLVTEKTDEILDTMDLSFGAYYQDIHPGTIQ